MSTELFAFKPKVGLKEGRAFSTLSYELSAGYEQRRALWPEGKLHVTDLTLRFPPNIPTTFENFFYARQGSYDTFLYKPYADALNTSTSEAIGTTDGTTTAFPLDFMYVDSATVSVFIDSTATTGWTLQGNNTAPRIAFAAAPSAAPGAITSTYEYYHPMRFVDDTYSLEFHNYTGIDTSTHFTIDLAIIQDSAGSHKV